MIRDLSQTQLPQSYLPQPSVDAQIPPKILVADAIKPPSSTYSIKIQREICFASAGKPHVSQATEVYQDHVAQNLHYTLIHRPETPNLTSIYHLPQTNRQTIIPNLPPYTLSILHTLTRTQTQQGSPPPRNAIPNPELQPRMQLHTLQTPPKNPQQPPLRPPILGPQPRNENVRPRNRRHSLATSLGTATACK
ncbi:uncharacterized protein BDW43DRAFT_29797 [Aspergillus alliaceus]|uniref:uncharacterized protein n=1 Tax=Petromyces alliaceus TaxID=209559 RepID=UPI0012A4624B|nr:uncharacterized protein BDW43DRAFT_29797 [Aspergillus alliaceus]KAB8226879.1 hypothetical protein BDW43DRAFT_29797 [Aspergillus alliaceus]